MALTVTLYSYKGGVGRSILAANLAVLLARRGKTLLCDFDLEAPGLHRIDDLSSASPNKVGLFEWLLHWQTKRKFDSPAARDLEHLAKSILPCQKQNNLHLLSAHGEKADAASLYQQIDWAHFLAINPEIGLSMLRTLMAYLREKAGFRYIILDSRTGITDIGGFLTAWLPDVTVLVGNYGAQNVGGLSNVWEALKSHAEDSQRGENGQFQPLRLELVASPIPADNTELQVKLRSQWEKDFGLAADSLIEIPERSDLRRSEAVLALTETDSLIVRKYHDVAARLLAIEAENERAGQAEDIALRQRPDLFLNLEKRGNKAAQGKTFEDRIADLLRLLGYRVEPEQTIDGNRVDLIASIQQGLDEATYFVECKDHQKSVGKEIVETLDVWLRTPKALERAARGMVVARRFSPQAMELARARNIRCFAPEDLERALIDFSTYLNHLISEFANSPLAASYVEQTVQPEKQKDKSLPLLPYALAWSRGEGSRLWVLLGDYGTGKTAFTRRFAYELAQQSLGNGDNPVPLLINLRDFPNKTSLGDLLHEHWLKQTGERRDPAIFLHLLARGRLLLLIDSFDEMGVAQAHRNIVEQFRMLAQPSDSQGDNPRANRVLITCREQFFREHGEALQTMQRITPDRLALLEQAARSFDGNIDVLPRFNPTQIQEYLGKRLGTKEGKQAWKEIRSIYNLRNLADRPQLLDIIIESLPDLKNSGETVTAGALYLRYTNRWLNDYRPIDRQSSSSDLLLILEALAVELWQRDGQHIHHGDLYALIKDRRLPSRLDPSILDIELRTAAFLSRTPDGYYGFSHRSFLEFFYAQALLSADTKDQPAEQTVVALAARLAGPIPSRETAAFFADLLALHDTATQKRGREVIAEILATPAKIASTSTTLLTSPFTYSASTRRNAYLLGYWASLHANGGKQADWLPVAPHTINLAGCQCQDLALPGALLGNAHLQDSDWSRSTLDGANLNLADARHACFSHASLTHANLRGAKLSDVNGEDTDLSGADLGQVSAQNSRWLNALFLHCNIDGADFSGTDLRATRFANSQGEANFSGSTLAGCTAPGAEATDLPRPHARPLLPTLRQGHAGSVHSADFSPDDTRVVSTSADNTLRLWDAHSGSEIRRFDGHADSVIDAAFSPDGTHIVSASADSTLRLWDAHSGSEIRRFDGHAGTVYSAAFSPDGTHIVSASADNTLRLWDAHSGSEIRRFDGHASTVFCADFSPDGTHIVSASDDNTLRLWDAHSGSEIRRFDGHASAVYSAAFSLDGMRIVSASDDNTLRLWDAHSGSEIRRFDGHASAVYHATFSFDGTHIVSASADNTLRLWDAHSGNEIRRLDGHAGAVYHAAFSFDGMRMVSASDDSTLRLWDAHSGNEIRRFDGYAGWVLSADFSSDGTRIVSASADSTLRLWDAYSGSEIRRFDGHAGIVYSAPFSPDGTHIVSASADSTLRLWDAHSGNEICRFDGHAGTVYSAAFSPDGTHIVSASADNTLRLWDAHSGSEIRRFDGHAGAVYSTAFSLDGTHIVSASDDNTLRLWDAHSGSEIRRFDGHAGAVYHAAFSFDGTRIISASDDNTLRLWDTCSGNEIRRFDGHAAPVNGATFSPDGTRIVSASDDSTLRLWDAHSGQALRWIWQADDAWFTLDLHPFTPTSRIDALPGPILRGHGPTPLAFIDPDEATQPAPWIPRVWYADDIPELWFGKA